MLLLRPQGLQEILIYNHANKTETIWNLGVSFPGNFAFGGKYLRSFRWIFLSFSNKHFWPYFWEMLHFLSSLDLQCAVFTFSSSGSSSIVMMSILLTTTSRGLLANRGRIELNRSTCWQKQLTRFVWSLQLGYSWQIIRCFNKVGLNFSVVFTYDKQKHRICHRQNVLIRKIVDVQYWMIWKFIQELIQLKR